MGEGEMEMLAARWDVFAHPHQVPPRFAPNGAPWLTWLLVGGRGAGKTRAGAEWIRAQALGLAPLAGEAVSRIALVGETEHDVREVMIEGVSGLLAVHARGERPAWMPSRRRLEWDNGAVVMLYAQGRVKHAGNFTGLEDEMCDFGPSGLTSGRSPDRLDALVWAITSLTHGARAQPRVRGL